MMFKLIPAESIHSFFQSTFDAHLSQANKKNHSNLCENFQVFGTILSVWGMLAHLIYPNVESDFSYFTKNKKGYRDLTYLFQNIQKVLGQESARLLGAALVLLNTMLGAEGIWR